MTAATLEQANKAMRQAVKARLDATDPSDEKMIGYQLDQGDTVPSCCEGQRTVVSASWDNAEAARADCERQLRGDSLLGSDVHPTSQAFFDLCDQLKKMHSRKSSDYGSAEDPLANIRNGAEFVGIEPWRAAMVRLSDKVTRLATYCRTGSLTYENFEDTCFDLASYSLLTLLTHREAKRGS